MNTYKHLQALTTTYNYNLIYIDTESINVYYKKTFKPHEKETVMLAKLIHLKLKVSSFFEREDGASAIEYAIIAGLIAVTIIGAAGLLGAEVSNTFTEIKDTLAGRKQQP